MRDERLYTPPIILTLRYESSARAGQPPASSASSFTLMRRLTRSLHIYISLASSLNDRLSPIFPIYLSFVFTGAVPLPYAAFIVYTTPR